MNVGRRVGLKSRQRRNGSRKRKLSPNCGYDVCAFKKWPSRHMREGNRGVRCVCLQVVLLCLLFFFVFVPLLPFSRRNFLFFSSFLFSLSSFYHLSLAILGLPLYNFSYVKFCCVCVHTEGKSVLACSLARDERVLLNYPDGTFWVTLGQKPRIAQLLSKLLEEIEVNLSSLPSLPLLFRFFLSASPSCSFSVHFLFFLTILCPRHREKMMTA